MRKRRRKRAICADSLEEYLEKTVDQDKKAEKVYQKKQEQICFKAEYLENVDFTDIGKIPFPDGKLTPSPISTGLSTTESSLPEMQPWGDPSESGSPYSMKLAKTPPKAKEKEQSIIDVMIIGAENVDKTGFLDEALKDEVPKMSQGCESIGSNFDLQIRNCVINGERIKFKFWIRSITGKEKYDFIYQVYYKAFNCFIFVYDPDDEASLKTAKDTHAKILELRKGDSSAQEIFFEYVQTCRSALLKNDLKENNPFTPN